MNLDEKKSIKKELKRKKKVKIDIKWIITISMIAFIISYAFSFLSETALPKVSITVGILILLLVILIGVVFDMIGVAVQAADETPFHSMNSRKIKGAAMAIKFKKNTEKVSSFCNDVIGDICGVISGSIGSMIAFSIANQLHCDKFWIVLLVMAFISAITIGGKAIGKSFAVNQSNEIIYRFAKMMSFFQKK